VGFGRSAYRFSDSSKSCPPAVPFAVYLNTGSLCSTSTSRLVYWGSAHVPLSYVEQEGRPEVFIIAGIQTVRWIVPDAVRSGNYLVVALGLV
jgi:hypothetical protein